MKNFLKSKTVNYGIIGILWACWGALIVDVCDSIIRQYYHFGFPGGQYGFYFKSAYDESSKSLENWYNNMPKRYQRDDMLIIINSKKSTESFYGGNISE